ncbi:unnamed protein product [Caenorhabditis sp. 36 PRJEB53466]|nr:unnamed protein product [Caenorhabditis sp. 36 PRJEB53466]
MQLVQLLLFFVLISVLSAYDWRDGQLPLERLTVAQSSTKNSETKTDHHVPNNSNFPPHNYYHYRSNSPRLVAAMFLVATRGGLILLLLLATLITPTNTAVSDEDTIIYDDYTPGMGNTASAKQVADQVAYGVISCITVGVLIVMLYMSLFGQRIRATAVRRMFTRSVFPAGMVFVYLEQIVLTIAPRLANSIIFNAIFFLLLVPFLNGLMIFLYFAHYMDVVWFYEPIDLFNLVTYLLFVIFTVIYFLFCLFGTCLCCATMTTKKPTSRTTSTFADMWLLFPYGVVPSIMYGPSFGMTSVGFAMKYLLTWVLESGLLTGGSSSSSSDSSSLIDMNLLMQVATNAILAMPWFVLLFPLVQSLLALVCLRMFREQFFFMISCGRIFEGKRAKIGMVKSDEWNVSSIGPPPLYPSSPSEKCIVTMSSNEVDGPIMEALPEDDGDLLRRQMQLEEGDEIAADLERWQIADMLADGVEIQEDVVNEEEEEEDYDWVTPLSREYSKSFSK